MRNPFKRKQAEPAEKALTASSEVVSAIRNGWSAFPVLGGGSLQRVVDAFNVAQSANYGWLYQRSPALRTVIDLITRNVGQLELRLFEELSENERQPRPDHPAALSLRYPNEDTPGDQFIRSIFQDFLIHDNAYARIVPAPGGQVGLIRIPAYMVEVQGSQLFRAENYRVWTQGAWTGAGTWGGSGEPTDFAPETILHWHGEHPLDPRVGLSRLDTLRDVVAEDAALAQAIIELANNGLQAPIWASRPLDAPEISADTLRAHEEDLTNRVRNRNRRIPLLAEGESLQSFGVSPQDAQMLEVRRWTLQRVAQVYGVPLDPNLMVLAEDFYSDCLAPYCQNFTRFLNQRILVRVYDSTDLTFEFNIDAKTGFAQLPNLISAAGRPPMTLNEVRAKLNLPPVPGGDEPITPGNVVVGGKPSVGTMPIQDPNKPSQDGSYRQDQGPTPIPSGNNGKAVEPDVKAQTAYSIPGYQSKREVAKQIQDRNIARFERTVGNYLGSLEPKLKAIQPQTKAGSRKDVQNWERWTADFATALGRVIRTVIGEEGSRMARQFAGMFDMSKTVNYRKGMAHGAAQQIMDTIRQEIEDNGVDWTLGRLPQHAASAGGSLGAHATIWARREAARQSPNPEWRQETWVKDTDRHAKYDGQSVPLDGTWDGGIRPGSTPGCRCTSLVS